VAVDLVRGEASKIHIESVFAFASSEGEEMRMSEAALKLQFCSAKKEGSES